MSEKLNTLYKSILATANMVTSPEGHVSMEMNGKQEPALIKGKRVVLPTDEHLRNPDWKERVAFHPLSENILRGESEVLAFFRNALNIRFNYTFGVLAYQLLTIATSPAEHAKLSPDQSEFLSKVKHADEKTLQVLTKLMTAMPFNQTQKAFVSLFLKRSGTVAGKRYSRVGVVTFPLYQELKKAEKENAHEVYGVKMRVKDREALIQLLEYMVPGIETPEAHNQGSVSGMAPNLDALMKAVQSVAGPINDLVALFENQLDEPDRMHIEDGWVETFENLSVMQNEVRSVPMLAGNEGAVKADAAATPPPIDVAPVNAPAPAFAPTAVAPVPLPPPAYQTPHQHYQAPGMYPPATMPPAPPAPVHTGRGLDFESMLRSNPALAAQVGGPTPMGNFNRPMQTERQPRWAAPAAGWNQQPQQSWNSPQPTYGMGRGPFGGI